MGANRAGGGTVKAMLNRLGAEGLIAAFRTSFRSSALELGGHVIVTPVEPVSDRQADALGIGRESARVIAKCWPRRAGKTGECSKPTNGEDLTPAHIVRLDGWTSRLRSPRGRSREHLVSPAGITVLRDEMGLVSAVVAARGREALAQRLEVLEPLGPLCLPVL
jgi:hypothetical protein